MKRLVIAMVVLAVSACPMALQASIWHVTHPRASHHSVVEHPYTRHYSRKADPHEVVPHEHVPHYSYRAEKHRAAHHGHRNHVKNHHGPTA